MSEVMSKFDILGLQCVEQTHQRKKHGKKCQITGAKVKLGVESGSKLLE